MGHRTVLSMAAPSLLLLLPYLLTIAAFPTNQGFGQTAKGRYYTLYNNQMRGQMPGTPNQNYRPVLPTANHPKSPIEVTRTEMKGSPYQEQDTDPADGRNRGKGNSFTDNGVDMKKVTGLAGDKNTDETANVNEEEEESLTKDGDGKKVKNDDDDDDEEEQKGNYKDDEAKSNADMGKGKDKEEEEEEENTTVVKERNDEKLVTEGRERGAADEEPVEDEEKEAEEKEKELPEEVIAKKTVGNEPEKEELPEKVLAKKTVGNGTENKELPEEAMAKKTAGEDSKGNKQAIGMVGTDGNSTDVKPTTVEMKDKPPADVVKSETMDVKPTTGNETKDDKPVTGEEKAGIESKDEGNEDKRKKVTEVPNDNKQEKTENLKPPVTPKVPTSTQTTLNQRKPPPEKPPTVTSTTTTAAPTTTKTTRKSGKDTVKVNNGDDDDFGIYDEGEKEKYSPSLVGGDNGGDMGGSVMESGHFTDDEGSHFFAYFLTVMVTAIIFYLVFHNKQRIIALIIEGRAPTSRRRRRSNTSRAQYTRLDNNLEEAMTATRTDKDSRLAL